MCKPKKSKVSSHPSCQNWGRTQSLVSSGLHHTQPHHIWSHGSRFDWNPQVLIFRAVVLLPPLVRLMAAWAASTAAAAAVTMATAAAVAAHHQCGEEHYQRQCQQHHQAHRVVDALVVLGGGRGPQVPEKAYNFFLHHGTNSGSRVCHHPQHTRPSFPFRPPVGSCRSADGAKPRPVAVPPDSSHSSSSCWVEDKVAGNLIKS